MSNWVVVPCLLCLRAEFNLVSPKRDKGADGTIGDSNHESTSDHSADEDSTALKDKDADKVNEVHALDIDSTGPWPDKKPGNVKGSWFDKKIHAIIAEEKRRWLDPNDMCRLNYVIWNGFIYDKDEDFRAVAYHGADPHTNHAHFSARYKTRAENDKRPWGVSEEEMLSSEDKTWLAAEIDKAATKAATKAAELVWATKITDYADKKNKPQRQLTAAVWEGYSDGRENSTRDAIVAALASSTSTLLEAIRGITTGDIDEDQLAERFLDAVAAKLSTPETPKP